MAINLVKEKKATIEDWELLIDSNQGIYIPQSFARSYGHYLPADQAENLAILLQGPDHDEYWDAWESVEGCELLPNEKGQRFTLFQGGGAPDLWAVPVSFDWDTYEDC